MNKSLPKPPKPSGNDKKSATEKPKESKGTPKKEESVKAPAKEQSKGAPPRPAAGNRSETRVRNISQHKVSLSAGFRIYRSK